MPNLYVPFYSLVIAVLLNLVFNFKSNIGSLETKIYSKMLITNLIDSLLVSIIIFWGYIGNYNMNIIKILNKIDFVMYLLWISNFFIYNYNIKFTNEKVLKLVKLFNVIVVIIIFITKVVPYNNDGIMFVTGISSNILYIVILLYLVSSMYVFIRYIKHFYKKTIPLLVLIAIIIFALVIRKNNPELIVMPAVLSVMNLIMYFTIENPDMKLLEELALNKNLLQHSNEEKSNLLFKLTQDVKLPVENICNNSKDMLNMKKINDLKNSSKLINDDANRVRFIINDVLNINDIDYNKIKVFNDTYDINILYKEIVLMIKNKINKEVKLNTKIDKDIPILYGDNIKLKQILYSLLTNSIKYTKKGNIEFNINHFIQYDVCRLIININDTGCGIDIDKINKVLNDEGVDINNSLIELDLNSVKKLINVLGGSIFIDSNKLGTKISIILDQRIYETEEIKHNKELNNYIKYIGREKNVLLIDDNYDELNKYAKEIKKYNVNVDKSMYGKDILNKIRNNIKYDLIIIDDEMNPYNAVTIMEELNKEDGFKTNIVVMLGLNKEFIKEHYIRDYKFKDYLLKRNYKTEIKRIIDKYL